MKVAETKPAFRTTEFWLTILAAIGVLVAGLADVYPGKWVAIAEAALAAGYAIARGLAKSGVPPVVEPVVVEPPVPPKV